ncbi:MAG: bifunctional acetate--CoA ligase family protein/GNAT family N-acetyltransferase, partial [Rhodospirillales bacterium]|nr:bifunctional acetate--CoA ligase family protein/GNAT family N-acetyltransferase [Rhodospirillales bacterium]
APLEGDLAFVTQSGAIVTAMLDWATPRGIGFSHVVSLGDMSDVDFGDMLDYLAVDPGTRAVLLYVEAITAARHFMSAARAAARAKPVIVIKGGRHGESARAAASHTGALAGSDAVYDAAFARAGMLRVYSLEELFDAAETLATGTRIATRPDREHRLAILTNGGGLGVLATDALIDEGGRLAQLAPETLEALDQVLPANWSHGNPVDIIGDAPGERYTAALEALLADPESDAVLVMNCPTAITSSSDAARAVVEVLEKRSGTATARRPVFTAWLGDAAVQEARQIFVRHRIPTFETPEQAVRAVMHLVRYRVNQELLLEIPPSVPGHFTPDTAAAREVVETVLAEGRAWLTEPEASEVLAAYGIPIVKTRRAASPEEAATVATEMGLPVALKILSPDIRHKSDVGGVALDLESTEDVRHAATAMLARVERAQPGARIDGFVVEELCRRPGAHELILGVVDDRQFGPVILFGQGGTAVEVIQDKALALPPLNMNLARALMAGTRVHRLLQGYRDQPPAALEAIAVALINLAQLATDIAEIVEVDINPLLADPNGVVSLDARIKVAPAVGPGPERLAIRPYPKELESLETLLDGQEVVIRPIRPEDAPALRSAFKKLTPRDVRFRFFAPMSDLSPAMAARLTQIDYDREMALIAHGPQPGGEEDGWGVVRIAADADNIRAEFAVVVRSDIQGRGIGRLLMDRILAYAQSRGTGEVWGNVLAENDAMLTLARELGFKVAQLPDEPGVARITKRIT